MANWYGTSRSNYFKVKDGDVFRAAMSMVGGLYVEYDEARGFMVHGDDDGYWPNSRLIPDPECPDDDSAWLDEDIWVPEIIAEHLTDDSIAVFQTVGAEKLRYLTGHATAINSKGEYIEVSIEDIYGLATGKFGIDPTRAEY